MAQGVQLDRKASELRQQLVLGTDQICCNTTTSILTTDSQVVLKDFVGGGALFCFPPFTWLCDITGTVILVHPDGTPFEAPALYEVSERQLAGTSADEAKEHGNGEEKGELLPSTQWRDATDT